MVNHLSDFSITKGTPYLALTGDLWGVFREFFKEKGPWYIETALCNDPVFIIVIFNGGNMWSPCIGVTRPLPNIKTVFPCIAIMDIKWPWDRQVCLQLNPYINKISFCTEKVPRTLWASCFMSLNVVLNPWLVKLKDTFRHPCLWAAC